MPSLFLMQPFINRLLFLFNFHRGAPRAIVVALIHFSNHLPKRESVFHQLPTRCIITTIIVSKFWRKWTASSSGPLTLDPRCVPMRTRRNKEKRYSGKGSTNATAIFRGECAFFLWGFTPEIESWLPKVVHVAWFKWERSSSRTLSRMPEKRRRWKGEKFTQKQIVSNRIKAELHPLEMSLLSSVWKRDKRKA